MQEIIVSDANIFIDLYKIGLLDMFFKLPFKVHTTDFILHELRDMFLEKKVQEYIDREKLIIKCFSANEISSLMSFHPEMQNRLSIQDRSIWFYAKGHRYVLLTGDKALRIKAENDGVVVHGILYIFDCLIQKGIISYEIAIEFLIRLQAVNKRLPDAECEKKINMWQTAKRGNVL